MISKEGFNLNEERKAFSETTLVNKDIKVARNYLKEYIEFLMNYCGEIHQDNKVEKLLDRLQYPFIIMVFGLVKVGKSMFINALLREADVTEVDVDIATSKNIVIKYAEEPYEREIKENIMEKGIRNEFLKDGLVIVDTPGIGSIIKFHDEITKDFIHRSDAIVVILNATNVHEGVVWEWLEKIVKENPYVKGKLIFVLQQKDRAAPEEITINMLKVSEYAIRKLGLSNIENRVFVVSAKEELEGNENTSGFKQLRKILKDKFLSPEKLKEKLLEVKTLILYNYEKCISELKEKISKIEQLIKTLENEKGKIEEKRKILCSKKKYYIERIEKYFDSLEKDTLEFIEHIPTLRAMFGKSNFLKNVLSLPILEKIFRSKEIEEKSEEIKRKLGTERAQRYMKKLFEEIVSDFNAYRISYARESIEHMIELAKLQNRNEEQLKELENLLETFKPEINLEEKFTKDSLVVFALGGFGTVAISTGLSVLTQYILTALLPKIGTTIVVDPTGITWTLLLIYLVIYSSIRKKQLISEIKELFEKEKNRVIKEFEMKYDELLEAEFSPILKRVDFEIKNARDNTSKLKSKLAELVKKYEELNKLTL